jgi:hypothetical protein
MPRPPATRPAATERYVLRVYRHDGGGMTGLIEQVETQERRPFHSAEELWRFLSTSSPGRWTCPKETG